MDKERNEEQEFLRDVERFLNGEEIAPSEESSEDARSTIEFAKKLSELRADPSPGFKERLESRLLRKLTEQEIAAHERAGSGRFAGFLGRLVPQSPVWRTAVVTVAIIVVAAGVMWRTGFFSIGDTGEDGENGRSLEELSIEDSQKDWRENGMAAAGEQEEETFVTSPRLESEDGIGALGSEVEIVIEISSSDDVTLVIEALSTQYGTEITFLLTYSNNSSEIVTIDPVQPEIVVRDVDEELVYTLPAVDGPAELLPSESFQMLYVWDQQDNSGAQVPAGTYRFDLDFIVLTWGTNSFTITPPSAEVVILEP